jgi:c-di-AMP phosphodiesterase-like protein
MEKLGGGGNRSAAAAQLHDTSLRDAVNSLFTAIDEYLYG